MTRLYEQVALMDAANKLHLLLDGTADAVAECGCGGLDIDGLQYLIATVAGSGGPIVRAFVWDGRMPEPGETRAEE